MYMYIRTLVNMYNTPYYIVLEIEVHVKLICMCKVWIFTCTCSCQTPSLCYIYVCVSGIEYFSSSSSKPREQATSPATLVSSPGQGAFSSPQLSTWVFLIYCMFTYPPSLPLSTWAVWLYICVSVESVHMIIKSRLLFWQLICARAFYKLYIYVTGLFKGCSIVL